MNKLDLDYQNLLKDILDNGVEKKDRTGTGTISVFGRQIRHKMSEGFPLLTTKKMPFKTITTELLWFLGGRTDLRYLLENNCHIWTGDAYKVYDKDFDREHPPFSAPYPPRLTVKEFEEKIMSDDDFNKWYGDLGSVYGKQWRDWTYLTREQKEDIDGIDELICGVDTFDSYRYYRTVDQIANLINDLKTNPDSRRLMVNAWNVGELDQMVLPPCHYGFQVYTRELSKSERYVHLRMGKYSGKWDGTGDEMEYYDTIGVPTRAISLMWNQRSVDTFLGLPFNIASYGLLLEIIAKEVNMVPDELIGNLGDVHLYSNHIEQAKEQVGRELSLEERTELAKGKVVPLLGSKEDSYNEAGIPTRTREPYPLPILIINDEFWNPDADLLSNLPHIQVSDFYVDNYQSHPTIKAPLSN
jgi:thymidylate synthase